MARGQWTQGSGGGIDTDGLTATPERVLNGDTFVGAGNDEPQIGTVPIKLAESYMPGTSNIVLPAGQYLGEDQTVFGDSGLTAGNIKKGSIIFGVSGVFEGYVAGPLDIYNRGTWAGGFTNSSISGAIRDTSMQNAGFVPCNISFLQQSIKLTGHANSALVGGSDSHTGFKSNKQINFTPYKTLNVVFSSNASIDINLQVFQGNISYLIPDGYVARNTITNPAKNTEITISVNILSININGVFSVYQRTPGLQILNIHKIYFTV